MFEKMLLLPVPSRIKTPMTTMATNAMINTYSTRPGPRSLGSTRSGIYSGIRVLQFSPKHTAPLPLQRSTVREITTRGQNTVAQRGGHQEGGAESRPPGRCGQPRQARGPSATQAEGPGKAGAVGQGPRRAARRVQPCGDTAGWQGRRELGAGGSDPGDPGRQPTRQRGPREAPIRPLPISPARLPLNQSTSPTNT